MNIYLFLILVLIFGITPNLGFFSFGSFFLLLIFGIVAWIILRNPLFIKEDSQEQHWGVLFIYLVSAFYYGGLYQNSTTKFIGQVLFFIFCIYIFFQLYKKRKIPSYIFIVFFLVLSLLTVYGSPSPIVDSFVIFKEAPLKLLQGINPYDSWYSKVYKNVDPHYYNLLPFSIIYFLPFVFIFNDPRFGIIFAMLGTYIVMNQLQNKNTPQKYLYSSLFLLAPRSFYMLEHAYLDTIIFFFIALGLYFQKKRKNKLFASILSCSFLLKQNIAILIPLYLKKIFEKKSTLIFFLIPFVLVFVFFVWNPLAFFRNIITYNQPNGAALISAPFQMTLAVPNSIFQFFNVPIINMNLIFTICTLLALLITVVILLDKRLTINRKIILILFFEYFFSYHAFFNSYYLVLLFLLFDFILPKKVY